MTQSHKQRPASTSKGLGNFGMLLAGIGLLVLGGMNLFTNVLQIRAGLWRQNFLPAVCLMLLFSIVPAVTGAMLVFRSTAPEKKS